MLARPSRKCTALEAVQVTKSNDRPDLSSEGAPDIEKKQ
jgi:hypothetical protein